MRSILRVLSLALAVGGLLAPIAASADSHSFTIDVRNDRKAMVLVSVSNTDCKPFAQALVSPERMLSYRCLRGIMAQREVVKVLVRVPTGSPELCEGLWAESTARVLNGSCTIEDLGSDRYALVVK